MTSCQKVAEQVVESPILFPSTMLSTKYNLVDGAEGPLFPALPQSQGKGPGNEVEQNWSKEANEDQDFSFCGGSEKSCFEWLYKEPF